ncbi:MAG: bifunctional diaminohydroxyphosphoribosylaminopyrimidine deaminase/5-amino-6-(5-phosphoribosylamino)uracil reductase RibD [Phascolarctobacterium sp.]|nr:bifunctional diaminohydroxyphosphoribosylaminopyrimidine deaminase/5-amino-6-(5-phosphoribosylamino)uracil reductase RibD [Phascolarctobacterium sp.]
MQDEKYMRRALELAELAEGNTSPNPMVGCVIVDALGAVVGEGYHERAGEAHAEIKALAAAGKIVEGSTVYVTLEPCCHSGRTGPCCKALKEAGVKRVVMACPDPNPLVAGKGAGYLRNAGIEVVTGICRKEAERLNEKFMYWITRRRPFVTLKYAMTLDGKIASFTGDSKWITVEDTRSFAHKLRKSHDAVLVGIGTVLADNPLLTTRMIPGKNPLRIVLDADLKVPLDANVLNNDAATLIVSGQHVDKRKLSRLRKMRNVVVLQMEADDGIIPVKSLMDALGETEITSILVEGGSAVLGSFKDAGAVNRVCAFVAPKILGGKRALTPLGGKGADKISDSIRLTDMEYKIFTEDILLTGRVKEE